MTQLDLQAEVDRKAFAALEFLLDAVECGEVTAVSARTMVAMLQTAFSGVVADSKLYFEMLTSADEFLSSQPKLIDRSYYAYGKSSDVKVAPTYIINKQGCSLKVLSSGVLISSKNYEVPFDCHQAFLKLHNSLIKKGLINICN